MGSPLAMLLQGLNLDKYGNESGATAPKREIVYFKSQKCQNLFVFLPFLIYQAPDVTFL